MKQHPKILIIEDDLDLTEVLRTILETQSYQVVSAPTGEEGLKRVKEESPDLIILDVMLEDYTKGFHVAYKLRSKDPNSQYAPYSHIPILMLTAVHQTTHFRFSPDEDWLPVDEFIEKPLEPETLLREVDRLLKPPKREEECLSTCLQN